ncbi:MAG: DUF4781 domain-containing protein, partial [Myxococcota bacterium]
KTHRYLSAEPGRFQAWIAEDLATYRAFIGDEVRTLSGTALRNEIGIALGLAIDPEIELEHTDFQTDPLFSEEASVALEPILASIEAVGTAPPKISVLPVYFSTEATDLIELKLFRVESADGHDRFVDHTGRTYDSIDDYRDDNALPPGTLLYPETGRVSTSSYTPYENHDELEDHLLRYADATVAIAGSAAAAALLFGSGGTAAPIVGWGASAYYGARAAGSLYDRHEHGQSLDPIHDSGARWDYITLGLSLASGGVATYGIRHAQRLERLRVRRELYRVGRELRGKLAHARRIDPAVQTEIAGLGQMVGGQVIAGPVKSFTRAYRKVITDFGGNVGMARDLNRGALYFQSEEQAVAAVTRLQSHLGARVVEQKNRFTNPTAFGLRDHMFKIRFADGSFYELQIQVVGLSRAKDVVGGFTYTAREAILRRAQRLRGGRLTGAERQAIDELGAMSRRGFAAGAHNPNAFPARYVSVADAQAGRINPEFARAYAAARTEAEAILARHGLSPRVLSLKSPGW